MPSPSVVPIKVQLRELAQLFNSMDPSPFRDRDLDADAEEFIVGWASELPHDAELELVVHTAVPPPAERLQHVEEAVRHYFAERAAVKQREFRQLLRRGRTSLVIALLFLAACLVAGEVVEKISHATLGNIVKEGLTIAGWVALWRPLEIYLYDWWPLRAQRRVLERLSRMAVRVVSRGGIEAAGGGEAGPAPAGRSVAPGSIR